MFIDVDEFGVAVQRMNKGHGRAHVSLRIWKPGHYTPDTKLTVLVAIKPGDGRIALGQRGSLTEPR